MSISKFSELVGFRIFDLDEYQVLSFSADTELTEGGKIITDPASGLLCLKLPNATQLDNKAYLYKFINSSPYFFVKIRNNDNVLLCILGENGEIDLHLKNNSTSAGEWLATNRVNLKSGIVDIVYSQIESIKAEYSALEWNATNKYCLAYRDSSSSNNGRIQLLKFQNGVAYTHKSILFATTQVEYVNCGRVDDDHVLLAWVYPDEATPVGRVVVYNTANDNLSRGTVISFNAGDTSHVSLAILSSTSAVVAYQDGDDSLYGKIVLLTISGQTITKGTENAFSSQETDLISVIRLTAVTGLIVYRDVSDSNKGKFRKFTLTDGVFGIGAITTFESSPVFGLKCVKLDGTHAAIIYNVGNTALKAVVIETPTTVGTPITINESEVSDIASYFVTSNIFLVVYNNVAENEGKIAKITFSENSLTLVDNLSFENNNLYFPTISKNDDSDYVSLVFSTDSITKMGKVKYSDFYSSLPLFT